MGNVYSLLCPGMAPTVLIPGFVHVRGPNSSSSAAQAAAAKKRARGPRKCMVYSDSSLCSEYEASGGGGAGGGEGERSRILVKIIDEDDGVVAEEEATFIGGNATGGATSDYEEIDGDDVSGYDTTGTGCGSPKTEEQRSIHLNADTTNSGTRKKRRKKRKKRADGEGDSNMRRAGSIYAMRDFTQVARQMQEQRERSRENLSTIATDVPDVITDNNNQDKSDSQHLKPPRPHPLTGKARLVKVIKVSRCFLCKIVFSGTMKRMQQRMNE